MKNQCAVCKRSLTRYDEDATPNEKLLVEQGEVDCCCGSIDHEGNYYEACCLDCWHPHEFRNLSGSGYYISTPR